MADAGRGGELVVVRHGQSTWNVDGRFTGQADPPLSDLGLAQAEALARRCRGLGIDAVVTSDLARAFDTGRMVADELGLPEPTRLPLLRERWSRAMEGMAADEIERRFPGQLAAWREAGPVAVPGEHEGFGSFSARVLRGLVAAAGYGDRVLVVAHAGIFVVLDQLVGRATEASIPNAEGRLLTVSADGAISVGGVFQADTDALRTGHLDP